MSSDRLLSSQRITINRQITIENLKEIFKSNDSQECYKRVDHIGGFDAIFEQFQTHIQEGLSDAQVIIMREKYGSNVSIKKKFTPIYKLIGIALEDLMLRVLIVAAIVSIILSLLGQFSEPNTNQDENLDSHWYEGATIIFVIVLIVGITVSYSYKSERQFANLWKKADDLQIKVIRNGSVQLLNAREIVVGDLIEFSLGDILNVDGIVVDGQEIRIDESVMTGESEMKKKVPYKIGNVSKTPFLISGTRVIDGKGTMLVLTTGENTVNGQLRQLLSIKTPPTPLQIKLELLALQIGKLGMVASLFTFLALITRMFINNCLQNHGFDSDKILTKETLTIVFQYFMISVSLVVMAVPEGLPLAITITLAYSVDQMIKDQNLVKNLASCEIMGGVNNICTDKTGTLTMNKMTVTNVWADGNSLNSDEDFKGLFYQIKVNFVNCAFYNSSCYEINQSIIGQPTDQAIVEYCIRLGYQFRNYRPTKKILREIPFNSIRKKRMTIVDIDGQIILYVTGAVEIILSQCQAAVGSTQIENLGEKLKQFSNDSLRMIALAYKRLDISKDEVENIPEQELFQSLLLIGIVGIRDPIRPDIDRAILLCQQAGITVRMVTGDNVNTAKQIAYECGILERNGLKEDLTVMEGDKFRQQTGGFDRDGQQYIVKNIQRFTEIAQDLRVLARATPDDKFTLVTGLMQMGNIVAVTGDGSNDAPALRKADVGFSMGIAGTQLAKDASDIIILSDSFDSIIKACLWGRNVYNNIRKFIQFQLTVNFVALLSCAVSAVSLDYSPLNPIQILWINMIMDSFASLGLATDPPHQSLLKRRPYGRYESIVNSAIYRTIVVQSIYQITVLMFILFAPLQWFLIFGDDKIEDKNAVYTRKTMFFQTFVLMSIFNSVITRYLGDVSKVQGFFSNYIFWIIFVIEMAIQYSMVQFGGDYANVKNPLTWQQQLIALGFGLFTIFVGLFSRCVPAKLFRRVGIFDDSESVRVEDQHQELQRGPSSYQYKRSQQFEMARSSKNLLI